ncbi:SelB C-terminal domain-containing protein [Desulfobacter sp.]|uniref:SelB domain-containing protein n=1 Tax=Desulfobacter sp. TaxID=2294 RepID=UPI003D0B3D3D
MVFQMAASRATLPLLFPAAMNRLRCITAAIRTNPIGIVPSWGYIQALDNLFFLCYILSEKWFLILYQRHSLRRLRGASRKYLIPLLEYFDTRTVTIRVGDICKLRRA